MSGCPSTASAALPHDLIPHNHNSHARLALVQRKNQKSRHIQLPSSKRYAYQVINRPLVRRGVASKPKNS